QFGVTAAVAILVSLVVSFTLTPMMSARLLKAADATSAHEVAKSRAGFYRLIDGTYTALLRFAMRHRVSVAVVAILVVLSSVPLYRVVKQDYLPSDVDESEFDVSVNANEGTSFQAMEEVMRSVEKDLMTTPGVLIVLASSGGGFSGSVNQGGAYVRIVPIEERTFSVSRLLRGIVNGRPLEAFRNNYSQRDVMQEIRTRLRKYKDLRCSVRNARSFNIGGGGSEIDFNLRGPDLDALAAYAEQLRQKAPQLGIMDADTTLRLDKPVLKVEIDRTRAADLGVSTDDIASALRLMVGGDQRVSRFRDEAVNEDYDVQLRLISGARNDAASISRLYVPRQNGELARLDNLVKIVASRTASRIDRLDRQRQVSLRAAVAPGYGLADRLEALRNEVKTMNLPAAYTTSVSGRARELERTFTEFIWAFLLSVIFMYMILASQFESVVHPLTILLSLPISIPFALFSLWATSNTLNLYSALGILVLFGVVKKNAILQIDHMNNLRRDGMDRMPAIMQANRDRLRPILMTTLALVAGMMPLALGTGPGADERRAIAVVVIGGQTLSLLLTLIVTPVAYSLFDDMSATAAWKWLAARAYAMTQPFRRRVSPGVATRRSASREMDAKADDKVKVGAGTGD
ncbi:MAG TPA: efflux RND transporter permease subunit, partial [Blastocatellia bacterium]|nr:efflux RND transporter permease subunit [Blastocatellia bacterium]